MTAVATHEVTEPGVYEISEEIYHRDPVPAGSLSVSGAKRLLPPSCPAIFAWERTHRRVSRAFDFGHAAHAKVLGVGAEIVVVQQTAKDGTKSDAEDYRTKSAQAHRDEIRASERVPLLASELAQVDAMTASLYEHPVARTLLSPDYGQPEQSLFWRDPETGIWRRSRLDWMPTPTGDGLMIVSDYKTADSASPAAFERAMANFGYDMQADWYTDAAVSLGLCERAEFLFIVQSKMPPFLVSVVQPDLIAMSTGRRRNRRAIETYARCVAEDNWPGYADDVTLVSVPQWHVRANEEDL